MIDDHSILFKSWSDPADSWQLAGEPAQSVQSSWT